MTRIGITALITARGGSKGIPRKNVIHLAGKPMIAWTIEAARAAACVDRLILSTDNEEIATVGLEWGAEVPFMRPANLAQDDSSHISVINHALDWLSANGVASEYLLLLQPTSPLRIAADVEEAAVLARARQAKAVVAVSRIHPHSAHPAMARRIEPDGTLASFLPPTYEYVRRQELPPAYAINGAIYLCRCDCLKVEQTVTPAGTLAYVMPVERSLDVDTLWDLRLAEWLLSNRHESN